MPRVIFAALIGTLAMTQVTVLPSAIKPHLVLILLLLWSAVREPREGLLWAFGAGFFLDLLTLSPIGGETLALLPVVVIGWASRSRFFQSGIFFPLVMAMAATAAHDLTLAVLAPLTGRHLDILGLARPGLLGALLNSLVVPLLYPIVQLLDRWMGRIEADARS